MKHGQQLLDNVDATGDIKVAYNDLTTAQKQRLSDVEIDYKLYVSSGRVSSKLKSKVVKEPLYEKSDIVSLIKMIIKEKNRQKVINALFNTDIPPIVIQLWLFQGAFAGTKVAWDTVVMAEDYVTRPDVYAYIIGSADMLGCKFKFPKKLRM